MVETVESSGVHDQIHDPGLILHEEGVVDLLSSDNGAGEGSDQFLGGHNLVLGDGAILELLGQGFDELERVRDC